MKANDFLYAITPKSCILTICRTKIGDNEKNKKEWGKT